MVAGYNPYQQQFNPTYNQPYTPQDYSAYNYNPLMPQPKPQQNQQVQDGGLVRVKSIEEARNYPVAPGHSVDFKVDNQLCICTKTLGTSALDQPVFEVFQLKKVEDTSEIQDESESKFVSIEDYKATASSLEDVCARMLKIEEKLQKHDDKLKEADKFIRARKRARAIEDEES